MKQSILFFLSIVLISFSVLFPAEKATAQENRGDVEFIQLFNALQQDLPRERVYLHTDRQWYLYGDRIWFSTYVTVGSMNTPSQLSSVIYVELYEPGGQMVERIAVKNEDGRGKGSMSISNDGEPGMYRLKAYTAWSLNFGDSYAYNREISVHTDEDEAPATESRDVVHLDFFPEGGHLVAGLESRVGIKAINGDGKGENLSGSLYDDADEHLLDFETAHLGMGAFTFTPEEGRSYYAVAGDHQYELPDVMPEGVSFSVSENEHEQYLLRLRSTEEHGQPAYIVFAHVRGEVYLATPIEMAEGIGFTVAPKSMFPTGPIHFTVLTQDGAPLAERLVFNTNKLDEADITAEFDQESYPLRRQVSVDFTLNDSDGEPAVASASVSVFDDNIESYNHSASNIMTKFLLESDVAGHIENPADYFTPDGAQSENLDYLMLTQGWRAFDMEDVRNIDEISLFSMPENGISVSGQVRSPFRGRGLDDATVVFSLGTEHDDLQIVNTDEDGYFTIPDLEVTGSSPFTIRANNADGGDNVRIRLSEPFTHLPVDTSGINQSVFKQLDLFLREDTDGDQLAAQSLGDRAESVQIQTENFADVQMRGELEEIEVAGERITEDQFERDLRFASPGSQRVDLDEQPHLSTLPVEALINQIPGVTVNPQTQDISISTGAATFQSPPTPLILIDGIESDFAFLRNMSPTDIQTINVFRRATELANFGVRGAGGVLSVRTRSGSGAAPSTRGLVTAFLEGYQPPTRFYSPRYGFTVPRDHEEPDNRITLHWESILEIEDGEASLSFFTNDVPSSYRLVIEGITELGIPFYHTETFTVRDGE